MPYRNPVPGPYRKGDRPPGARDLNAIIAAIPTQLRGGGGVEVSQFGSKTTINRVTPSQDVPEHFTFFDKFVVVEEFDDYLKCAPFDPPPNETTGWWDPQAYLSTLGADALVFTYVAKPTLLQKSYWNGRTISYGSTVRAYTHVSTGVRTSTELEVDTIETIQVPYFPGDIILAFRGVTGITATYENLEEEIVEEPIFWIDGNFAARAWAVTGSGSSGSSETMVKVTDHLRDENDYYPGVITTWSETGPAWVDGTTPIKLHQANNGPLEEDIRYRATFAYVDDDGVSVFTVFVDDQAYALITSVDKDVDGCVPAILVNGGFDRPTDGMVIRVYALNDNDFQLRKYPVWPTTVMATATPEASAGVDSFRMRMGWLSSPEEVEGSSGIDAYRMRAGWLSSPVMASARTFGEAPRTFGDGPTVPVYIADPVDPAAITDIFNYYDSTINYYDDTVVNYYNSTIVNFYDMTVNYTGTTINYTNVTFVLLGPVHVTGIYNWYFDTYVVFTYGLQLCGWLWYCYENFTVTTGTINPASQPNHVVERLFPSGSPTVTTVIPVAAIEGGNAGQFLYWSNVTSGLMTVNGAGGNIRMPGNAQLPHKMRLGDGAAIWYDTAFSEWTFLGMTYGDFRFGASAAEVVCTFDASRELNYVPRGNEGDVLMSRGTGAGGQQKPVWEAIQGGAEHFMTECVDGVNYRYKSTTTFIEGVYTQGAVVDGAFVVGAWVFDSFQGCCDCGPPPIGITTPCCEVPVPSTLCVRITEKTGDCVCLPDSFTVTWNGSEWAASDVAPGCEALDPLGFTVSCGGEADLFILTGMDPEVGDVNLGNFVDSVDCGPPFIAVWGGRAFQSGSPCTGTFTVTVTAPEEGGECATDPPPPPPPPPGCPCGCPCTNTYGFTITGVSDCPDVNGTYTLTWEAGCRWIGTNGSVNAAMVMYPGGTTVLTIEEPGVGHAVYLATVVYDGAFTCANGGAMYAVETEGCEWPQPLNLTLA